MLGVRVPPEEPPLRSSPPSSSILDSVRRLSVDLVSANIRDPGGLLMIANRSQPRRLTRVFFCLFPALVLFAVLAAAASAAPAPALSSDTGSDVAAARELFARNLAA